MKNLSTFLFIALLSMISGNSWAYDAEINGVYYNFNGDEAEVTYGTNEYGSRKNYNGEIVIPASVNYNGKSYNVTAIGEKAFAYNDVSVNMPEGIKIIKEEAFCGCTMISLKIPSTVERIKKNAFFFWNPKTDEKGNVLNSIPKIIVPNLSAWMKIEHESHLFTVEDKEYSRINSGGMGSGWALYTDENMELKELIVPDDIDSIRAYAFSGCRSFTSVSMKDRVKSIGNYAFYRCLPLTNAIIGDGVTSIGDYAFSISTYENVTEYRSYVSGSYERYKDNPIYGLRSVSFGKNVKNIGKWAFAYNKLTSLKFPENLETIDEFAFRQSGQYLSLVIPNKVTTIGNSAFGNNAPYAKGDTIQSLTIGSGVLKMDGFYPRPNKVIWLTNTPPEGYNYVEGAMNYVSNNLYTRLDKNKTLVYPLLSSIFAVDGVKYVPTSMAERKCEAIDAVYDESAKLTKIGASATYRGVVMNVNYVRPYTCCGNTFIENVELTDLINVEDHVFDGCENLQSVKLPETVEFLGESSFQNCTSLTEIAIPAETTEIKHNAFKSCTGLKNVTMNDGSKELILRYNYNNHKTDGKGTPLFESCPLNKVYIGRNISYSIKKTEGYSPFYRNTSLREVEIADRETEISENEFYGCTGLKSVKIGDGVTTFGNWAFSDCSSLDYFEFGTSVKTIGKEAFSDCAAVKNIISHAVTPPVCESQAMDDINKWDCTLTVPDGATAAYQAADQWKEFLFTQDYSTYLTDIDRVNINSNATQQVFSLDGSKQKGLRKGINIIRSNGKMKKVLVK